VRVVCVQVDTGVEVEFILVAPGENRAIESCHENGFGLGTNEHGDTFVWFLLEVVDEIDDRVGKKALKLIEGFGVKIFDGEEENRVGLSDTEK
jgi:hypothetical protein